ncbi:hypothetical protein T439DRAFT_77374 [Meredithblackwellia eburnea MCA 4105]
MASTEKSGTTTTSPVFNPCRPCQLLKRRCVLGVGNREPFPCMTCTRRNVACFGGEILQDGARKTRKKAGILTAKLRAQSSSSSATSSWNVIRTGSASPATTRARLAREHMSVSLIYQLVQAARAGASNSWPTTSSRVRDVSTTVREAILSEGFKTLELGSALSPDSGEVDLFVEMKLNAALVYALFLGFPILR